MWTCVPRASRACASSRPRSCPPSSRGDRRGPGPRDRGGRRRRQGRGPPARRPRRSGDRGRQPAGELASHHLPGASGAHVDLADDASVESLAEAVLGLRAELEPATFGLVHCAGLAQITPLADSDPATWDLLYRVNQRGPLLLTRALLPALREAGASVVFVGSDSRAPAPVARSCTPPRRRR
nr:SDR family NAD(P)-dependent oxidoreductase [Nocardioides alcanivorans]